jgi:hypothetical protein
MPTPGIIQYPAALDDLVSLVEAANAVRETLTAGVNAGDLLIPVTNIGRFSNSGIATLLDHPTAPTLRENFVYTSKSGNNLVVPAGGRGAQGTTAQSFATGAIVAQRPTARHHGVLADAIIALQNKLGIGADTPGAAAEALMSNGAGVSQWRGITAADIANVLRTDLTATQTINSDLRVRENLFLGPPGNDVRMEMVNGGTHWRFIIDAIFTAPISIERATAIVSFAQIPLLPGANPTTANQAVRKQYVDDTKLPFSVSFFDADPSTSSFFVEDRQGMVFPINMVGGVITHVFIRFHNGSNLTGGDTLTYTFRKKNTGGGAIDFANVTLNSSTGGQAVWVTDIADVATAGGDSLTFYLSGRNGNITPRCVTLGVMGTHKRLP